MGSIGFRFESRPTFRDIAGRFARATNELQEDKRDMMRGLGRRFVALAGEEARGGKGGTIAKQVGFRTFVSGDTVGFQTRLGPIAKYHVTGTGIYGPRNRLIRPVRAKALHFFVGGDEVFAKYVRGVKPDPYLERAHERWELEAEAALRRISTRWVARVTG